MMALKKALVTPLQRGNPEDFKDKREAMIREALAWEGGTQTRPIVHPVDTLPTGEAVYFLKPGKEARGEGSENPNDMLPVVGTEEYKPTFGEMWGELGACSVEDPESFKCLLVLLYRDAFLLDHSKAGGTCRYQPSVEVRAAIDDLERQVGRFFRFGVLGHLQFMNLLGWNEDIKYQVLDGVVFPKKMPKTAGVGVPKQVSYRNGRLNTFLTTIKLTYTVSESMDLVVKSIRDEGEMDVRPIYETMANLSRGGVSAPTANELRQWLYPYITPLPSTANTLAAFSKD